MEGAVTDKVCEYCHEATGTVKPRRGLDLEPGTPLCQECWWDVQMSERGGEA